MKIFSAFMSALLVFGSLNAASDEIGKVIAVEGNAQVGTKKLKRGTPIFVSDLINVEAGSKLQVKFNDGGLLNLIESTQYRVDSYKFKDGESEYSAELIKGGFRAFSGDIGKQSPDNYNVKTPVATIGIRGTVFLARVPEDECEGVAFGCDTGKITVKNDAGIVELNEGQYLTVTSADDVGQVSNVRPDSLSEESFSSPEGGESIENAQSSSDESSSSAGGTEEGFDGAAGEAGGENGSAGDQEIDQIEISESEGNPPC